MRFSFGFIERKRIKVFGNPFKFDTNELAKSAHANIHTIGDFKVLDPARSPNSI